MSYEDDLLRLVAGADWFSAAIHSQQQQIHFAEIDRVTARTSGEHFDISMLC